jgi:predicted Zn-dependent protease with MMP-like domain
MLKVRQTPLDRKHFINVVAEVLDSLPERFRTRVRNVAVLVEDLPPQPPGRKRPRSLGRHPRRLVLGMFHGVPLTRKSVFDLSAGPDYIVLYQKNIEAICSTDDEIRQQIRQTVLHELGHYFGMSEAELEDV